MRVRLDIEYDGTGYCGWQRQDNAISVQEKIEEAVRQVTGEHAVVRGSGRTDAGVHALGQVAHFDTQTRIPPETLAYALNFYLPDDIRILRSAQVADDFHAQYGARSKTYRYVFRNDPQRSALFRNLCAHERREMDLGAMRRAATYLLGAHDFKSFSAHVEPGKSTVRTIKDVDINRSGPWVTIEVTGTGFLHNMVRIIAGTLAEVGKGEIAPDAIPAIIEARDRRLAGPTAPATGLFLVKVCYD